MKKYYKITMLFFILTMGSSLFSQQFKPHYPLDSAYFGQRIYIAFDTLNNPWLATWSSNQIFLLNFNSGIWNIDTIVQPISGLTTGFVIDQNNVKWIASGSKGLYKVEDTVVTNYNQSNSQLPGNWIRSMTLGLNNELWIGCRDLTSNPQKNYIVNFNGSAWTIFDSTITGISNQNNSIPEDIEYDPINNKLYVVTNNPEGIFVYFNSNWSNIDTTNSNILYGRMQDLEVDSFGNLWTIIDQYPNWNILGLAKYDGLSFSYYNFPTNVYPDFFDIDSFNNLWFETGGDSIIKFDRLNWNSFVMPSNLGTLPNIILGQFVIDNNNSIWMVEDFSLPSIVEFNEQGVFTSVFNKNSNNEILVIYPNPFNNQFTVEYEADSQSAYLAIYNLMGVKIAEQPIISTKTKVDVGNISNGIYFVIIQDGIKKLYHKLVKQ